MALASRDLLERESRALGNALARPPGCQRPHLMSLDLEHLLKLRLVVGRYGEMDGAGWWNTQGILGRGGRSVLARGFPGTHGFAQARIVCAVAAARCAAVFSPPGCITLWNLPAEIEDALSRQWNAWCRRASDWQPFFHDLAPRNTGSLDQHLTDLGLIDAETLKAAAGLRRSAEGKAIALPGTGSANRASLMLLAAGFSKGDRQGLAVPYLRMD